jgi:RNA polymerase sigma factor (sigma-70 family)
LNKETRDELFNKYFYIVKKLSHKFYRNFRSKFDIDFNEFISEGSITLLNCIDRIYDKNKECDNIEGYIFLSIRLNFYTYLKAFSQIRRNQGVFNCKKRRAIDALIKNLNREPSENEIALYLNISLKRYHYLNNLYAHNAETNNEFNENIHFDDEPMSLFKKIEQKDLINKIFKELYSFTNTEQKIVFMKLFQDKCSFMDITTKTGIPHTSVQRRYNYVIKKIQNSPNLYL